VYDITNEESFNNIQSWLADIDRHYYSPSTANVGKPSIILVGNKCDLDDRKVTTQQAQKLAQKSNLLAIETSAKSSFNVETAFINLISEVLEKAEKMGQAGARPPGGTVKVGTEQEPSGGCGC